MGDRLMPGLGSCPSWPTCGHRFGLGNLAGFLLCCVGVLFSMPIVIAAMMYAYETIFSAAHPQAP